MLQQQPAARFEVMGRLTHDDAQVVQPIFARSQGTQGFMGQCRQVRVGAGDVGWVRDDGVELGIGLKRREPRPRVKLHRQP